MNEPKSRTKPKTGGTATSEFGAVTIDFNPGPDAEDRLRRLFTLLLNHVASAGEADPGKDVPAEAPAKNGVDSETASSDAYAEARFDAAAPS